MDFEDAEWIRFANQRFGEKGWSCSISNLVLDFIDEDRPGIFSAGASAQILVRLGTEGIFREHLGYGISQAVPSKGEAISKAKKAAVTDGFKGAMGTFGGEALKKLAGVTPSKTDTTTVSPLSTKNCARNFSPVQAIASKSIAVHGSSLATQVQTTNPAPSVIIKPCSAVKSNSESIASAAAQKSPTDGTGPIPPSKSVSEEERKKAERIRRQKQLQEEFRQNMILQQAKAQVQSHQKQFTSKSEDLQLANGKSDDFGVLDVDDEPLLSTQDLNAALQLAHDPKTPQTHARPADVKSSSSTRLPMVSSPSQHSSIGGCNGVKQSSNKRISSTSYATSSVEKRQKSLHL